MHEQRPTPCRDTLAAQMLNGFVEREGDVIEIQIVVLEQSLVKVPREFGAVLVVHEPEELISAAISMDQEMECAPHRTNDTPKATEEHRSCEVHGLIWCEPISFRSLAGTKIRQDGTRKFQLHDVLDSKLSVLE
jgi:hypothetical protein